MIGLTLALKPSVRLLEDAAGLEEPGGRRLRLSAAGPDQRAFLRALAAGGSTEEALCASLELRY